MFKAIKSQQDILNKLKIEQLNPMQVEAGKAIHANPEVVLLSPTGTGKTLAFLLPIIQALDPKCKEVQVMVIVPSRELAIQIEQVTREMGTGFKNNAVYGGRPFSKDLIELKHPPAIIIGTPGRMADHLRNETFSTNLIKTLVLDEFDKSLEIGFEEDMSEILYFLSELDKKILTSATQKLKIPGFVELKKPVYLDYLQDEIARLKVKTIISPDEDKLETLVKALCHIGNQRGIIFCNFKDTIQEVSGFLSGKNIPHGCFYGGMEQKQRERALIKFRNGTHRIIIATDLAARGIDVPELNFIIHFQLPMRKDEFIHRNGRTARMNSEGVAYVLKWEQEQLIDFIHDPEVEVLREAPIPDQPEWQTVFISGGRKDKISKGDIAGLFFKQGGLEKDQVGIIELKHDCAFVAVHAAKVKMLLPKVNNTRLKKKKVRVRVI